jgi:hypothetical protein
MNKVKKRIYRAIDRLAHKAAVRFDRISMWAFWKEINIEKKKYGQTASKYDPIILDSWAKDIREQEQESMEALARFSEMQMKMDEKNNAGYEIIRQPVNGGLVGIRRPIEKENK